MKPTFQEAAALIVAVLAGAAMVFTQNVSPEIASAFTLAIGYILGSRTSQPN